MTPYQTIWLNPRQTFEELVKTKETQSLIGIPLFILSLSSGLNSSQEFTEIFGVGDFMIGLITGIFISTVFVFIFLGFIYPWLIRVVGLIWKGEATLTQLTNVCSISLIPFSLILFYQLALLVIGKELIFDNVYSGLVYVVSLWSLSLFIIGVSKVQKFSYGFALLSILLSQLPFVLIRLAIRN